MFGCHDTPHVKNGFEKDKDCGWLDFLCFHLMFGVVDMVEKGKLKDYFQVYTLEMKLKWG